MTFEEYLSSLKGKSVAVIGIGVSNRPLIELLLSRGIAVTACDRKEKEALGPVAQQLEKAGCCLQLGEGYLDDLHQDVIFRSPGIRPDLPSFQQAVNRGSQLTSEMEVFFQVCPCRILAVTGSDGKTTTTTIISKLLEEEGYRVHVGGNIGHPLLAETPSIHQEDIAVLELSSFQLMTMRQSPHIAVVTNLAPNHLDVHKDLQEYICAKENIFTHQSVQDVAVFNADNPLSVPLIQKARGEVRLFSTRKPVEEGAFFQEGKIYLSRAGRREEIMDASRILLPGMHNVENYLAAFAAVRDMVSIQAMEHVACSFGGVEHRIELIRTRQGVRWYNDSIASSPSRTIAGLRSFPEKVILIAGGKDKGISYTELGPVVNDHVKFLILCGATAEVIARSVREAENYAGIPIVQVENYHEAVALADREAGEGDVVILSPASTSFDRFANFMERGKVFKDIVNQLP